jgi:hypothetical protein
MSTVAFNSSGSQLKVSISSVFTLIPGIKGFNIPSPKQVFDDTTNLDSPSGFPERISVGKDFTTCTFDMVWDPDNTVHTFLETAAGANPNTTLDFTVILANTGGATYTFSAFVDFERKADNRKAGIVSVTLNVTGAITRTV